MWSSALLIGVAMALAQPPAADEKEILSRIALSGESARTARRLQAVDKTIAEKKWSEAVDELQRIMAEAGDDLVPLDFRQCIQARRLCQLRLAALPADALRLYRGRVDSQARKWLDEGAAARDAAVLGRIVDESFCSRFTDQALDRLGDLAFERGAFDEAEHWWRMIALPASQADAGPETKDTLLFPDPQIDVAGVRAKLLLAHLFRGDPSFAYEWKVFQAKHAAAAGHLAGRDGNYAQILQGLASRPGALAAPSQPETWSTFAGAASRNFAGIQAKGRLRRIPQLNGPQWTVKLDSGDLVPETPDEAELSGTDASDLHFYPLIVGDRVFTADARYINAYELDTGRRVLQYDVVAENNRDLDMILKLSLKNHLPHLSYTLSISGGRLYARLGAQGVGPRRGGEIPSYLVCLNLHPTLGRLKRWLVKAPEAVQAVFEGTPVVHGGRAYAAITHLGAVQTQTAVLCLNADTGVERWQRDVCEMQELKEDERRFRHHLLTVAGTRIIYCSHSGAVAALDADSGRRLWALRYPSRGPNTEEGVPSRRSLVPCLYAAGRLYVAPMDYDRILCLDPDTGHVLWESPMEVMHLLGVTKGRLFLNTVTSTGTGIPLQHNLRALDTATGAPVWLKPDDGQTGLATVGRGLLAGNRVYWPTSVGLIAVDQDSGEVVASDKRIQGNLAAAAGCLVAAGKEKMTVYLPEE